VRGLKTKFGESAGKIWQVLNEKGCLKKDKILETTKLDEVDFHAGLGWLARENKISEEDKDCFKLDNTNLESEIGANAGKVWKILDIWGDADFINCTLGWLVREEKIYIDEKQSYNLK